MAPVRATPTHVPERGRVLDRLPAPVRERVRAVRARIMVDRRAQSAAALAFAVVAGVAVASSAGGGTGGSLAVAPSPAISVPSRMRLVTIVTAGPPAPVRAGSRVDLVARSTLLVADVMVVERGPDTVVVAVPATDAPTVATAASLGEVTLVVLPG